MKISFNFDRQTRSFHMTPEDDLEQTLMNHLTELCEKGATLRIKSIQHPDENQTFLVEMKISGKENGEPTRTKEKQT